MSMFGGEGKEMAVEAACKDIIDKLEQCKFTVIIDGVEVEVVKFDDVQRAVRQAQW